MPLILHQFANYLSIVLQRTLRKPFLKKRAYKQRQITKLYPDTKLGKSPKYKKPNTRSQGINRQRLDSGTQEIQLDGLLSDYDLEYRSHVTFHHIIEY